MSEVTDLVVIEKQNAMAVFTTKEQLDPIIEAIEKEARSLVPDVSTRKGRDAIASMAHKVARSKTYIDNAGKDLVAELKALPKQIDESRRIVRERLDALKDEVRKPLTDWENAESARKDALQQRLNDLRSLADVIDGLGNYLPSVDIQQRIESAKAVALDESWQEVAAEAGVAKDATIQQLEAALIVAKQREHEAAELERLRKAAMRRAGIRYRRAYQSRHTYACWSLAAGANPNFIAKQMGHTDAQMVYRVYGSWMAENNQDQVLILNQKLSEFAPSMPHAVGSDGY